jgi:hypothetical protein
MKVIVCMLAAVAGLAGCAHSPSTTATPCYTESGWLDASNGCSARAGYPDCYLVCPGAGTRTRVEKAAQSSPANKSLPASNPPPAGTPASQ